jgi:FkbM family methyltransferase
VSFPGDHPANPIARAHRASLPDHNDFDLETLMTLPPYWGWIEHRCDPASAMFRMMLGGNDDGIALRLYWNGQYERTTLALWSRLVRAHALALDIGAHTGIYTLAAQAATPSINVLSFEASTLNYARLTLNLRANQIATTNAYPLGASDCDGMRSFTLRTHADYHSSGGTFEKIAGGRSSDVRVVALDSFLPAAIADHVGVIKLDVEGHEPAALSGMRGLLARVQPTMIFECLTDATASAVDTLLRPLGYRFFELDERMGTIQEIDRLVPALDAAGNAILHRLNRVAAQRADDLAIVRSPSPV